MNERLDAAQQHITDAISELNTALADASVTGDRFTRTQEIISRLGECHGGIDQLRDKVGSGGDHTASSPEATEL